VDECIADIGNAGSIIFSIFAFHQMLLDDESPKYTSFTIPPLGNSRSLEQVKGWPMHPLIFNA
jgi:hypothetical protein